MKDLFGNHDPDAIYRAAISEPLVVKIAKALAFIREYEPMALELSGDGYYVAFSGGKDSIVMEKLFQLAGVKYRAWYNNVTIDPPELVRFIKRVYPEVTWSNRGKNLPMMMADVGMPPTRIIRWCCNEYKERNGVGSFAAIGVRSEESPRRKGMWAPIRYHYTQGSPIMCPILYWTDRDIWDFIRLHDMAYCELYDQGFTRLGCIGCPMNTKRAEDFKRWPKYEQMWRRGFQALWDKYKGVPRRNGEPRRIERFNHVDEYFDWWMETENVNDTEDADCQMYLW